ncbi:hypothetical protein DRO56_04175 [Candidatus Bathyarchaeota archaeon]|nr:MAG: hypothetical protein DRO56_04175 [Candidatus Bathyarchaeota archaeon]
MEKRGLYCLDTTGSFKFYIRVFLWKYDYNGYLGSLASASVSAFLASYVESELRLKKILEVVSGIIAMGIIVYGYIITRSLILGVITLFILAMLLMAFAISYLQPAIHRKCGQNVNQFY